MKRLFCVGILLLGIQGMQAGPIHDAAAEGKMKVVRGLLDTDPKLVHARDAEGNTPMHVASTEKPRMIKLLLKRGAHPRAKNNVGQTPLHTHMSTKAILGYMTRVVGAFLWGVPLIAEKGIMSLRIKIMVDSLLDAGANVNARDNKGNTPLHTLAGKSMYAIMKPPPGVSPQDFEKSKAELVGTWEEKGGPSVAIHLIKRGADFTIKNNAGQTPYDVAKANKRVFLMATLKGKAAIVGAKKRLRGARIAYERRKAAKRK